MKGRTKILRLFYSSAMVSILPKAYQNPISKINVVKAENQMILVPFSRYLISKNLGSEEF